MSNNNVIFGINGPVVTVKNSKDFSMLEMVFVGESRLIGEVIGIDNDTTTIQVYEDTSGLAPGQPVISTNNPLSLTLGPGIITNIFDGIERPLRDIKEQSGTFISKGSTTPALDTNKLWDVTVLVNEGDILSAGQIYASCPETESIIHYVMVPPNLSGTVTSVKPSGQYKVEDTIIELTDSNNKIHNLTLSSILSVSESNVTISPLL